MCSVCLLQYMIRFHLQLYGKKGVWIPAISAINMANGCNLITALFRKGESRIIL